MRDIPSAKIRPLHTTLLYGDFAHTTLLYGGNSPYNTVVWAILTLLYGEFLIIYTTVIVYGYYNNIPLQSALPNYINFNI
jgi:hypothetical protein